jgi:hypothetical protein
MIVRDHSSHYEHDKFVALLFRLSSHNEYCVAATDFGHQIPFLDHDVRDRCIKEKFMRLVTLSTIAAISVAAAQVAEDLPYYDVDAICDRHSEASQKLYCEEGAEGLPRAQGEMGQDP